MPSVLFICTANICRSPLAAAIFRQIVADEPDAAAWEIGSAGTWTIDGDEAAEFSRQVVRSFGQSLDHHRSRNITQAIMKKADIILTMEAFHKEALQAEFPALRRKILMLSELVGLQKDVRDPYGGSLDSYEETARLIESYLRAGLPRLRELLTDAA
jgi:protein-tyrosine-phosphatase